MPSRVQVARARSWARARRGVVSFGVINSHDHLHGLAVRRRFVSASVVKAMLLVSYLERFRGRALPRSSHRLLSPMIRISSNVAASRVYRIVGSSGLYRVARRARMKHFWVRGNWTHARLTAEDQARFFYRLEALSAHHDYARHLLSTIVGRQSWAIPHVARPRGWHVIFKGGWRRTGRGQLIHQVARLSRGCRRFSVAVLTDGSPSSAYGRSTVRGIARILVPRR